MRLYVEPMDAVVIDVDSDGRVRLENEDWSAPTLQERRAIIYAATTEIAALTELLEILDPRPFIRHEGTKTRRLIVFVLRVLRVFVIAVADMELTNKVALITGGKRIGLVIAGQLAARGVDVVLGYARSRDEAEQAARSVRASGRRAEIVQADLSQPEGCQALVGRRRTHSAGSTSFSTWRRCTCAVPSTI